MSNVRVLLDVFSQVRYLHRSVSLPSSLPQGLASELLHIILFQEMQDQVWATGSKCTLHYDFADWPHNVARHLQLRVGVRRRIAT